MQRWMMLLKTSGGFPLGVTSALRQGLGRHNRRRLGSSSNKDLDQSRLAPSRWELERDDASGSTSGSGLSSASKRTIPPRARPATITEEEKQAFGRLISRLSANLTLGSTEGAANKKGKSPRSSSGRSSLAVEPSWRKLYEDRLGGTIASGGKMAGTSDGEMVDIAREQISRQSNEVDLLNWALMNIFPTNDDGPSNQTIICPSAALKAGCAKSKAFYTPPRPLSDRLSRRTSKQKGSRQDSPKQFSSAYPYLIAETMSAFRTNFKNPYLAIAIFEHARRLSMTSYILGCGTDAYNQLLQIQWTDMGSLQGVYSILKEMKVNAVPTNGFTENLAQSIRDESRMALLNQSPSNFRDDGSDHWFRKDRKLIMEIEALASTEASRAKESDLDNDLATGRQRSRSSYREFDYDTRGPPARKWTDLSYPSGNAGNKFDHLRSR